MSEHNKDKKISVTNVYMTSCCNFIAERIGNLIRDLLGQSDGHVAQHAFGGGIWNALESVL